MKAIDVNVGGPGKRTIHLSDAVTVVKVAGDRRKDVAASLEKTLGRDAVVLARRPVASTSAPPAPEVAATSTGREPDEKLADAEAAVASAEAAVQDARSALESAEAAYAAAQDALLSTSHDVDRDAHEAVRAAEARLEVAQAAAAAARRAVVQAREASERDAEERTRRDAAAQQQISELQAEKATLVDERAALTRELAEIGAPPESRPVEEALSGLRRLRQVKPRSSERAASLADRWVGVRERLAALPMPPAPPEWLVTPALAALQEAREALARAEADPGEDADPAKVEAVERAHREVLEAEQRVMRKGSRANRRRLEQAQDVEREALKALGVASYGDYLQRVAPGLEGGASAEERVAQARAALADAEAVWEELHGGQASPEYTAAKAEEAEVRTEAYAILGDDTVDDADLEERLRAHVETVVDTEWAVQQLRDALSAQGVEVPEEDSDLEAVAEAYLAGVPARREAHEELDRKIGDVDARLRDIDDALATHDAGSFFGSDDAASAAERPPEARVAGVSPEDPFADLTVALDEADAAERDAAEALAEARRRLDASEQAATAAAGRERDADEARAAVEAARTRLEEAEAALAAARQASHAAAEAADVAKRAAEEAAAKSAAPAGEQADTADGRSDVAEAAWLLARLVAARAAAADKPIVIDATVVPGAGSLRLLERVAARGQVIVLGDDGPVGEWATSLGDRAVIRSI